MPPAVVGEFFEYLPPDVRPVVLSAGESTYRSATHAREIDFFIVDPRFASFTEQVKVMHAVPASPHYTVSLRLIPNPHQCRVLVQVLAVGASKRRCAYTSNSSADMQ